MNLRNNRRNNRRGNNAQGPVPQAVGDPVGDPAADIPPPVVEGGANVPPLAPHEERFRDQCQLAFGMSEPLWRHLRLHQGLNSMADLAEYDDDMWKTIATQCNTSQVDANGQRLPPVGMPVLVQTRLKKGSQTAKYHSFCGRPIDGSTVTLAICQQVHDSIKLLLQWKENPSGKLPKLTKNTNFLDWQILFEAFLARQPGASPIHTPLAYGVRPLGNPGVPSLLEGANAWSVEHGSVVKELIARMPHVGVHWHNDNAQIFHHLQDATAGTTYASSINPYRRSEDGRAAYLTLAGQFGGANRWDERAKAARTVLRDFKWNEGSKQPLDVYFNHLRSAKTDIINAKRNGATCEKPNDHTIITDFLSNMTVQDPQLVTAITTIKSDEDINGLYYDFEKCTQHLLKFAPKKRKRDVLAHTVSALDGYENQSGVGNGFNVVSTIPMKVNSKTEQIGIGKTGVHFRYYTASEFSKLNAAQKAELSAWRSTHGKSPKPDSAKATKPSRKKPRNKQLTKNVSSLDKRVESLETLIQAASTAASTDAVSPAPNPVPASPGIGALQSILQRARHPSGS